MQCPACHGLLQFRRNELVCTNCDFELPDFGSCCGCGEGWERGVLVRNVIMVHFKIPERLRGQGRGWGCVVCGLPSDGASVVLCDGCAESSVLAESRGFDLSRVVLQACAGWPAIDGRVPLLDLTEPHAHDLALHTELQRCRFCGCTDATACIGDDGLPCHWIAPGVCSACAARYALHRPFREERDAGRQSEVGRSH